MRFDLLVRCCLLLFALSVTAPANACSVCEALGCSPCGMSSDSTDEPPIARFRVSGSQWPQPGGDGSPVTITYSYNNFLDGGLLDPDGVPVPADYLRLVTKEAFGLWASVAPLHFVEVEDVGTPVFRSNSTAYRSYPADSFGQIRLAHYYRDGPDTPTEAKPKAEAFFPSAPGYLAGDIFFDNGDPWAIVGTSSEPDVLGILTHEIGHAIGIAHSTIPGTVMFPAALRRMGPGTGVLLPDDIAAVQSIYGVGVGSVTVLVPEPTACLLATIAVVLVSPRRTQRPQRD